MGTFSTWNSLPAPSVELDSPAAIKGDVGRHFYAPHPPRHNIARPPSMQYSIRRPVEYELRLDKTRQKCEINYVRHSTLDAVASRSVPCLYLYKNKFCKGGDASSEKFTLSVEAHIIISLAEISNIMPASGKSNMATSDELLPLLTSIGLSEQKAKETLKNAALTETLKECIQEVKLWLQFLVHRLSSYDGKLARGVHVC